MRPSLEAEIIDLEKRIATLEKNKIGNLRREHGEIVSTYEKMFNTLRFVNFNKILMVLKINMMDIKSLEEDCSRECTKNQLVILLQKEMAKCLVKMIQIGHEENSLMFESNQRLRDKIRLKRLEIAKMLDEKEKLLAKINRENKVVIQEKNIDHYCVPNTSKFDIFSPTYDTAGYHPKILKQSKIPVLILPLTSVVETVPFQIRKKPVKVTIPHDRPSVLKKPYPGRVVKTRITHNCERKSIPKTESYRLGEKQKQHGKRAVTRKSSNNFTVTDSKNKTNVNSLKDNANKTNGNSINNNVMIAKKANVENNNSVFVTPKSASKIPVRATPSSVKKRSNKENNCPENLTPVRAKLNGVDDNHEKLTTNNNIIINNNNNGKSISVEEAAVVFKSLNDYCDRIEQMYGKYSTSPSNIIEQELAEKRKPILRKPVLCNPCIGLPIKFWSEKKPNSPEVTAVVEEKFYGSMESIRWNNSDVRNGENNQSEENPNIEYHKKPEDESQLSSSSMDSTETGTTVISVDRSVNGNSSNRDDLCEPSLCLETFLSASKCFTPPNEQFRAGGDCFNSSVAGNFRYLESENNSPNTPDKFAQYRADTGANQESPDSTFMVDGKRRKSEIFHISFHSDRKKELSKEKSNPPTVFKVL